MGKIEWSSFMRRWNDKLLASDLANDLPAEIRQGGWLGFPSATDASIGSTEDRLKILLPRSYKAFLGVSNGWHKLDFAIDRVRAVESVEWFRAENSDWIEAYSDTSFYGEFEPVPDEEYFSYGDSAVDFRREHLKQTLQISDVGDGVILLNPQVVTADGEWEAWFFANWLPGARRYRSFVELMTATYAGFAEFDYEQPKGLIGGFPNEYIDPPGTPNRRLKAPVLAGDGPDVATLLSALGDTDLALALFPKANRVGSTSALSGLTPALDAKSRVAEALGHRGDPAAVAALIAVFDFDDPHSVWIRVLDAIGSLGGPLATRFLFDRVMDGGNAAVHASHFLKNVAPRELVPHLLQIIAKRDSALISASMTLGEMNETVALPLLSAIATDPATHIHLVQNATVGMTYFGAAGLNLLASLLDRTTGNVRGLVVGALLQVRRPEVRDVLEQLANDPDPEIRRTADIGLKTMPVGS